MKDKFSYEVKDFVPTKRRTRRGIITRIAIACAALLLTAGVGFGLYLNFHESDSHKRDKKPSSIQVIERDEQGNEVIEEDTSEFVLYALKDFADHMIGEKSHIEPNGMRKLITTGRYDALSKLKLIEMKDFGLGIENFLSGIAVKATLSADASAKKYLGELSANWTIIGVDILQYAVYDSGLRISSEDFFKESILMDASVAALIDTKIGPLLDEWAGMLGFKNDADYKEFRKTIDAENISNKTLRQLYEEYGFEIKCRRGEGENTYLIKFVSEKLSEPYIITLRTNDACELTGISIDADFTGLAGVKLEANWTGEEHPSDKFNGELSIALSDFTISGNAAYKYVTGEDRISIGIGGTDGADEIYLKINGEIDTEKKAINLSEVSFTLNKEKIVEFSIDTTFTEAGKDASEVVIPNKSNVINIMDVTGDTIDGIVEQIQKKIDYYAGIFADFL